MLGLNVFAADTDAEAQLLFTSLQQAFVNLRTGRPANCRRRWRIIDDEPRPDGAAMLDQALACAVVGSPDTVRRASTPSSAAPAPTN